MFTPWSTFFSDEGRRWLRRAIDLALDEDGPDLTAEGLFAADAPMRAVIRAKEDTRVVGLPVIHEVFAAMGAQPRVELLVEEASAVRAMTEVARMEGPAIVLLKAERVILNFITHLSGIANLTARYVHELEGTGVRLLDTRKTTPGLRWPEKYAVQAGGGCNHRKDLTEMLRTTTSTRPVPSPALWPVCAKDTRPARPSRWNAAPWSMCARPWRPAPTAS